MEPDLKVNTLRELWQHSNEQHWLPVQGISMLPLLRNGDRIKISHNLSKVQRGDILVFQQGDGLVAHRVVQIAGMSGNGRIYLTKGDNCTYFDAPLQVAEILGRVDSYCRNGKEYDLTTPQRLFWNGLLANIHLLAGNFFQSLRKLKKYLSK